MSEQFQELMLLICFSTHFLRRILYVMDKKWIKTNSKIFEVHVKFLVYFLTAYCNNISNIWFTKYSQTWVNDRLRITTTCLHRPLFWDPNFYFHNIKLHLNNDHLSTTATNFGSRGWSLYTGLTVLLTKSRLLF